MENVPATEMSKYEAGEIVQRLLRLEYWSWVSTHDRVNDGEMYAIETEITHKDEEGEEVFIWNTEQRDALKIVGQMTPEERRKYLEIEIEEDEEDEEEE